MQFGLPALLFVAFFVLKLTDVIDWSWLWIFSPLWIPLAVSLVVIGIVAVTGKKLKDWIEN